MLILAWRLSTGFIWPWSSDFAQLESFTMRLAVSIRHSGRCRHISSPAMVGVSGIWTSSGGQDILGSTGLIYWVGWSWLRMESAVRGNMMNEELFSVQGPGSGRWCGIHVRRRLLTSGASARKKIICSS
ncbi:hypothetical protein AVEN_115043-1 [Araneus ventricosus]|uniref:Uncharacterized protein n=1 Tax=Araneus ventricosus TaxID=182803 RepID=A0A4Y1ZWZ4_ARAVE|nr:hypothetical protein AVEN_115043-1 [Araneus ventricosus]